MKKRQKIRIVLADHQNIVRQGILFLLEEEWDFEVVGEAVNGLEMVRLVGELKPNLVVMEPRMPKLNSVEAIRQVKAEHPQAAVLILTMDDDEEYAAELLAAGAAGYLVKTASFEELTQSIRLLCVC